MYVTQLEYDVNFGALVRRKSKYPLDGLPFVVGISCLLRQFHPAYSRKVLSYMGQFVRSSLTEAFSEVDAKAGEIPRDIPTFWCSCSSCATTRHFLAA